MQFRGVGRPEPPAALHDGVPVPHHMCGDREIIVGDASPHRIEQGSMAVAAADAFQLPRRAGQLDHRQQRTVHQQNDTFADMPGEGRIGFCRFVE
ncbi:MAG: hypothetical protein AB7F35_00875 [Acetobacteraceae bacterium]